MSRAAEVGQTNTVVRPSTEAVPRRDTVALWLSVSLTFAVSIARASADVQWRSDLAALRDQGLWAVGPGGGVSTFAQQFFGILPLGGDALRAAAVSATAAAVAAGALFSVARPLLRLAQIPAWLQTLLALAAAVMATLSPSWQREATVGGGAAVAAALLWCGVYAAGRAFGPGAKDLTPEATTRWLQGAIWLGLTLGESLPAGAVLAATGAALGLAAGRRPPWRFWRLVGSTALFVMAVVTAPFWLRTLTGHGGGPALFGVGLDALEPLALTAERPPALLAWVSEVGWLPLVTALFGLAWGVIGATRRVQTTPLLALVAADLIFPASTALGLETDGFAPLRLGSLGALSIAASLGVADAVVFLRHLNVPMARVASVFTVVFHITLIALTCEEAAFVADRSEHVATDEWTDAAFELAPARSAIVVHSPSLAWRLWRGQRLSGRRPDVIVIPAPLLRRGQALVQVLPEEPAAAQLLRDFALHGKASELGMTALADARPVLVELDPDWDARMVDHLRIEGPWLRFAPQRLGASDRPLGETHALGEQGRLGLSLRRVRVPDEASQRIVARTLKEHVSAMSLVGMSAEVGPLIDHIEALAPDDPFVTASRLRVAHADRQRRSRRALELRDLLRFGIASSAGEGRR
ncbi:MAG: hypothetical protein AAGA56_05765 [Myxococcota bacterium]